ncbi:MAG: hypothetical protein KAS32_14550 [Candidatus Peribacteraceae bacterium]|nr:hypothetical protein [Candidatus Peribacteraceae bacterium]
MIIQVGGLPDSGKTHFGLNVPDTTHFLGLDAGFMDVLPKFQASKDIILHNILKKAAVALNDKDDDLKKRCQGIWNDIMNILEKAFDDKACKTITIDQETTLWKIRRHAEFGLEHVRPSDYEICNYDMDCIYQRAAVNDKHVILLTHLKDKWTSASTTDGYKPDGYKNTIREVSVSIQLILERVENEDCSYLQRSALFDKCKPNINLLGTTICNLHDEETGELFEGCEYVTFAGVMSEVYGGDMEDYQS